MSRWRGTDRSPGPGRPSLRQGLGTVWLVARREVVTRGRSKSYLLGIGVSVVLAGLLALLPNVFGDTSYRIGVAGGQADALRSAVTGQARVDRLDVTVVVVTGDEAGRRVAGGELDAVLRDDGTLLVDGAVEPRLGQLLEVAYREVATERRLRAAGLDPAVVAEALAVPPLRHQPVGEADTDEAGLRLALAIVVVVVMLLLIYLPAIYVAVGVVEEKGSRVVELLLAAIRPWQLLAGKIVGIGLLGLAQLAAITAVGLGTAALTGLTVRLPPGLGSVVAGVFGWFVLGYAFFGAMAAAAGSLVSRQEEVNGVLVPVTAVVAAAYVVGFLAVVNPNAPLAHTLSMVPPLASVVMPVRLTTGSVPVWQLAVAAVLMVVATVGMLAVGARIYQRAVLRVGARVRLSEVWGRHPR